METLFFMVYGAAPATIVGPMTVDEFVARGYAPADLHPFTTYADAFAVARKGAR